MISGFFGKEFETFMYLALSIIIIVSIALIVGFVILTKYLLAKQNYIALGVIFIIIISVKDNKIRSTPKA